MMPEYITEPIGEKLPDKYDITIGEMKVIAKQANVKVDKSIFDYTSLVYDLGIKRGMKYQRKKKRA